MNDTNWLNNKSYAIKIEVKCENINKMIGRYSVLWALSDMENEKAQLTWRSNEGRHRTTGEGIAFIAVATIRERKRPTTVWRSVFNMTDLTNLRNDSFECSQCSKSVSSAFSASARSGHCSALRVDWTRVAAVRAGRAVAAESAPVEWCDESGRAAGETCELRLRARCARTRCPPERTASLRRLWALRLSHWSFEVGRRLILQRVCHRMHLEAVESAQPDNITPYHQIHLKTALYSYISVS